MEHTSLVGMTVDAVAFDVERGKVREFAIATRAGDPAHVEPAAAAARGGSDLLATATDVVVAGHHRDQQVFVAKLGMDIRRIVVGSTSSEYLRPLHVGDSVTGERTVIGDEVRTTASGSPMRLLTLETAYTDLHGNVLVIQREVLIERGTR